MEWLLAGMTSLIAGLAMIGVLVVIHEFGHLIVAKMFRIGVPVFSVGMGSRLYGVELLRQLGYLEDEHIPGL
jgi:membrane-associated protease RseP (regulator of RpoE activity)